MIGGWAPGEGQRSGRVGALVTGLMEDGKLSYVGKVGTGFTDRTLAILERELAAAAPRHLALRGPPAAEGHDLRRAAARGARRAARVDTERHDACALVQGPARRHRSARLHPRRRVRPALRGNFGGMARAIWSGAISFGLVNIPVKLFSAVSRKTVRFHQIDAESGARVRQKRVGGDGEEIPYEQIVKGYEIGPDRYVTITPEELESLEPQKTRTIDIEDFVDLDEHRPDLLRPPLLPGARHRGGQGLPPAGRRDGASRARSRSRASCCAPRSTWWRSARATACSRWRRCCSPTRWSRPTSLDELAADERGQDERPRARDGQAADRVAHVGVRAREVPRRVPRPGARPDRAQGAGRDGRDRGARRRAEEGAGPDGGARGEHRRRRRARRRSASARRRRRRRPRRPRWRRSARGRGRGPDALPLQPRQGAVPRSRASPRAR